MLKKLLFMSLAATFFVASLGTASYGQKPSVLARENKLTLTNNNSNNLSIVTEGFEALCFGSSKDAYTKWASHSIPILSNMINEKANGFDSILNTMVGKCTKYSVIGTAPLTKETQIVYVNSEHETGALFWKFLLYQGTDGWLISSVSFNTDPTDIVPESMLLEQQQV
ncbi:MAG: hypothetical protein KME29_37075 [Calothrix sp. FI2-JRJ7]|jgi:hypothetical protein|nr:hypothetical protein [Calothrix sp. FI2-JRJ7]